MSDNLIQNSDESVLQGHNDLVHDQTNWEAYAEQAREAVSVEEQQAEMLKQQGVDESKEQGFIANNPIQAVGEVASAVVGGGIDAVESVGSILKLSGDTIQTGISTLYGSQDLQDPSTNIFHKDYSSKTDIIPDHLTPQNRSGLGRLTRGLVEFGLLSWATAGAGSAIGTGAKAAKLGTYGGRFGKALGLAKPSGKVVKFLSTGKGKAIGKFGKVASEGGVADLITQSSEMGNIANLVNEHAPFLPLSEALSVQEDDNPWLARIKTVAAGAGMNITGHYLIGLVKGMRAAKKAKAAGKTVEESNIAGTKELEKTVKKGVKEDALANTERADQEFVKGNGIRDNRDYLDEYLKEHLDQDEYTLLQQLYVGKKVNTGAIDTRGRGTFYHGTRQQFTLDKDYNALEEGVTHGIYGDGLYTTEDFVTAKKLSLIHI